MTAVMRVMWKEYRMLRSFWLALAVCGIFIQVILIEFTRHAPELLSALVSCAVTFTYCFALGAAATIFAVEKEEQTLAFLQFLPLRPARLLAGKLALVFLGTVLMALAQGSLSYVKGRALLSDTRWHVNVPHDERVIWFSATATVIVLLHMMGWGLFFSLKSTRPLLAAVLAIVATVVTIFALAWSTDWFLDSFFRRPVAGGEWFAVAAIATMILWYADLRIGQTWLLGQRASPGERRERQRVLRRLLWQEFRRSYRLLAALAVFGFFCFGLVVPRLLAVLPPPVLKGVIVQSIAFGGLFFALLGACTFHGDQERSQFRFFSERGIAARRVWLGRQVFWVGIVLVTALLLLVEQRVLAAVFMANDNLGIDTATREQLQVPLSWFALGVDALDHSWRIQSESHIAAYLLWILMSFGAGQLCSMLFRSGILAAVFGVLLAGVLLGWAALMDGLDIGWWWSVAPLAIALFAATWARSAGWIVERRNLRAWLGPAAVLLIPLIAILAAVPCYRVWEIPESTVELTAPAWHGETSEDATLVVKAFEQLPPANIDLETLTDPYNTEVTEAARQWLKANEATLKVAIRALLRLRPDVSVLEVAGHRRTTWWEVAAMMLRYGQLAEGDGRLDEAWRRYLAVLKLSGSLRRRSSSAGETWGGDIQRAALAQLVRWSAQKGQTAEQLDRARAELQSLDAHEESLADVVRRVYLEHLEFIDKVQTHPEAHDPLAELVARWAPWEFSRARRLLRYGVGVYLLDAQDADAALADRAAPVAHYASHRWAELQLAGALWRTSLLRTIQPPAEIIGNRRYTVACRRGTQLVLAIEAWKLTKGTLPEKLESLVGPYFDKLPLDPFNNRPFSWLPWGLRSAIRCDNVSLLPAGTPLLHSDFQIASGYPIDQLDQLRRRSANEPLEPAPSPAADGGPFAAGGMPGAAMSALPAGGLAAGIGAPPGPAPTSYQPSEWLHGLVFPVLDAADTQDRAGTNPDGQGRKAN